MKLELDRVFLSESGVSLGIEDLRLGLSLGLISPPTAVALASEALHGGSDDPAMLELAQFNGSDIAGVRDLLSVVDPEDAEMSPPRSVRKWTYLELKAAYELRELLNDPLGVVEQIYADFDYPPAVAGFVRYMPSPAGAAVGEIALYDRWRQYLAREARDLSSGDA